MADQDMRLRLVVRRNSLPELRLMWHVKVDSNPSISKLLEQLNEHVPLESEHWGLEDYVVELHDGDGTDFECLHYQLVRSVLKPDDRVFIRALDQDDHRRRRISGRLQISTDGRHLIDGVPFGRPSLRTPTGRPPIHIPPRKRARFIYTQPGDGDDDRGRSDSPVHLLTNGEPQEDGHAPPRTQAKGDSDEDTDSEDTDSEIRDVEIRNAEILRDYNDDEYEPSNSSNESEIEETEEEVEDADSEIESNFGEEEDDEDEGEAEDLTREACDLAVENVILDDGRLNSLTTQTKSLDTLENLTILSAAFPGAPINRFEKVLAASHNDLKTAYEFLSRGLHPQLSQEVVMAWKQANPSNRGAPSELTGVLTNPTSTREVAGGFLTRKRKFKDQSPAEDPSNDDEEEHHNDLWRKYDHAGFPPGTITSGTGLKHMAAVSASFSSSKTNGNSETTSTTLKAATEEPMEEDDDTSSSGTSSDSSDTSSSGSSSDSDDTSSNGDLSVDSDESDNASEEDSSSDDSLSQSSSADSDESSQSSSDDSSGEPNRSANNNARFQSSSVSESSISDNESDSGPEEYPFQTTSGPVAKDKEHNESGTSSDETSDSNSSSDSEEDANDEPNGIETLTAKQTGSRACLSSSKPTPTNAAPTAVPPGAGKESTKRRNARRRAAKVIKREMQKSVATAEDTSAGDSHVPDSEAALFEAKRKALLDALAAGGIEVGPSGETTFDQSLTETNHGKQEYAKEGGISSQPNENQAAIDEYSGDDEEEQSPNSKRRRIDIGAGRRLVFGALGLRNPKNKEDEARLRDKLQAGSQLHANRQVSSQPRPTTEKTLSVEKEDDINAWMLKINYRAVECCHDNIELSPAPFPFQQRWDPQQQTLWFSKRNKRGGQSKGTQRNQAHYYNDDSQLGKKRKRNNSYEMTDDGFDRTGDRQGETANGDDIILNYDDDGSENRDRGNNPANEISQTTDLDDLPSLPEDVSTLPILRPGEARLGMVIAWQKWSCSSATSWQPQLSRVTAVVIKVDDEATALGVCLAKRDRYLDGNEKRYDHITGQRIYDKFEAPDLHEGDGDDHDDGGVEDGYRNIAWADMQDPRILQEPMDTTVEFDPASKCLASIETDEKDSAIGNQTEPIESVMSNQREPNTINNPLPATNEGDVADGIYKPSASPEGRPGDSSMEPCVQAASNSTSHQAGQNQQTTNSAMSDISQISSPSRQLHETTSQAIGSHSPIQSWARTSSIGQAESPSPNTPSPMVLPTTVSSQPRLGEDFDSDLITGTPDLLPRAVIPSSGSSVHSGRQPDYAMDIDDGVLDPFNATDEIDHGSNDDNPNAERSSLTPVPICRAEGPSHNDNMNEGKGTERSPIETPIPRSPSSASSIFCTAVTSHSTQSPSRVQMSSITSNSNTSRFARNAKFEDAMRKLDEQFSDDFSDDESTPLPPTSSLEVKQESSAQFVPQTLDPISPPPRRRRRNPAILSDVSSSRSASEQPAFTDATFVRVPSPRRPSKPFTIPPGSQVVELSSDSEPVYTEDYADEDIDGTYSPELGSMPTGDGWVQKRRSGGRRSVS